MLHGRHLRFFAAIALANVLVSGLATVTFGKQGLSVTELISQLKSSDVRVQTVAVDLLAESGDGRAVPPILQLLPGSNLLLQMKCIEALGKLRDPRAIPPLIELLGTSTEYPKNFSIAEALGSMAPQTASLMAGALQNRSGTVREWIASALGRLGNPETVAPLIEVLSDSLSSVRAKAATSLGELGDKRATDSLHKVLSDEDPEVRVAALGALGKMNDPTAIPMIAVHLKEDVDPVRAAAARALGGITAEGIKELLIGALSDRYEEVRSHAAEELARFKDPTVVQGLTGILSDKVLTVRMAAARSLGQIGDAAALPFLIKVAEKDDDSLVRYEAAQAIAAQGQPGFDWLMSAVRSRDPGIRGAAASGLAVSDDLRSVEAVGLLVRDTNGLVRMEATRALGRMKHPEGVPFLLAALSDSDRTVRSTAQNAIARLGSAALPGLVNALRSDASSRENAAAALAQMGPATIGPMLVLLKSSDLEVRGAASLVLGRVTAGQSLGAAERAQVIEGLKDSSPVVRMNLLSVLAQSPGPDSMPAFMDLLHDPDSRVRVTAIKSLTKSLRPPPFTAFTSSLADSDSSVRAAAAEAIAELADPASLGVLSRALSDPDSSVRSKAVAGIANGGPRFSASLIGVLEKDPDWRIRSQAARALGVSKATDAIEVLAASLTDKHWNAADVAAIALQSIGRPALPVLLKALEHPDPDVRELAAESLGAIADSSAVAPLISRLSDDSGLVRTAAAGALGRIGEGAAMPLLSAAQQDQDPLKRDAALWALRFLEGGPAGNLVMDGVTDPDDVRNRLRSYFHSSLLADAYTKSVEICGATFCLEKYVWPQVPLFFPPPPNERPKPPAKMEIDGSGVTHMWDANGIPILPAVRRVEATLVIDASGTVTSVTYKEPGMASTEVDPALRSLKFGHFSPETVFPVRHPIVLEFSAEGRARYRYGRPWIEFGLDRIRVVTHPGLAYIN